MTKKLTMAGIAIVAAFALVFVAVGHAGDAVACDKAAKTAKAAKADGKSCSKEAKTASASSCSKSAAAKTASASGCSESAAAKTASASGCSEASAAKTASAGCCAGAAAAKVASSGCSSTAAKTASAGCCEGLAAVAGYSKAGNKNCDTKACPASACDDKYAEALNGVVDEIPQAERSRVVLNGTIECAHCTYDAVGTCQPLLKTADGKVYPMLHGQLVKRMKKSGAATVEVTSNVRNAHGVKYLDVKAFKAL